MATLNNLSKQLDSIPQSLAAEQRKVARDAAGKGLMHYQDNVGVVTGELRDSAEVVADGSHIGLAVSAPHALAYEQRTGLLQQSFEVMVESARRAGYVDSSS